MIECIFTLDYELYGNGIGSLRKCVLEPTRHLAALFGQQGLSFVIFPEMLGLIKMEEFRADPDVPEVLDQLRDLYRDGFEIGLHLHSWWHNATIRDGHWVLDWESRNLCHWNPAQVNALIGLAINRLRRITASPAFTPIVFRNGLWVMQPTPTLAKALRQHGLLFDSTIFKGGRIADLGVDYRPSLGNGFYWRFREDVNMPDLAGDLYEVPIFTDLVPFWKMVGAKRLSIHRKAAMTREKGRVSRKLQDFLRFQYPRKLDFCRMTHRDLECSLARILKRDKEDPRVYKPIVLIGHSKDYRFGTDIQRVLDFLARNKIVVTNFLGVQRQLRIREGQP